MARLAAILRALALALRRDQKSLLNLAGNNFFIVSSVVISIGCFFFRGIQKTSHAKRTRDKSCNVDR